MKFSASLLSAHDRKPHFLAACFHVPPKGKLKKEKSLQILSTHFLFNILHWSLAYLKIVIRYTKKEFCQCSDRAWQDWSVASLYAASKTPLHAPSMLVFTRAPAPSIATCLRFCSVCSNCGTSRIMLLQPWHTQTCVITGVYNGKSLQENFYFRCFYWFLLFSASRWAPAWL